MLSLIPEPKQVRSTEKEPWRAGGVVRLQLSMELEDPRLALHCRRAFPGREVRTSVLGAGEGYSLLIEGIVSFASAPDPDEADLSALKDRPEGYHLEVSAEGAIIRALDAPGLYYGLQTLLQLQSLHGDGDIPAVSITDWPDTELRVMNFDLRQTFSKPERLIGYLAEFSRYKTNAVLIEYEDKFPFNTHHEFAHPQHALSREELEALQAAAHEHFIEIIPLQQSFGHLEYVLRHDAWKHLRETEESTGEICPSHPQTYELITGLLAEMMDAHPESRYIHLGCDEVYSLCECEACRKEFGGVRERAFISFLNRLIEFTASRGRQPIFWHDMLDKCPPEELAKLDPRSAAMIWIYNGRNIEAEVTSLTHKFRALDIEVMGAPAVRSFDWSEHQNYPVIDNRTDNLLQWAETAEKLDIRCMVATNWTGPFSLGVPYGVFETTWYPMLLHADLAWNRRAEADTFIDRFLELFHGISPETGHSQLGNYQLEDYYDIIWKLRENVQRNMDYAELIAIMHDFEVATDRSRAIHKYAYRWELYPGDSAEWRSLLNNYTRNRNGREAVRPRMLEALLQYQPQDMAEHFVTSRFYLHDYLERTLYRDIGLTDSPQAPANMSLEDKIALMCVVGTPSTTAEPEFRERMSGNRFGGIGLFPHNVKDEQQTLKLMAEVQTIAGDSGLPQPYYVSIDEEGGTLSKFKTFYPYIPGNRAAGLSPDAETAYLQGKIIGSQLHALGIPMNWAPVLDVNTNIDNPVVGVRSFGEDPEAVAAFGKAYIQGMHEAGVAVTAKHFPGHGQVSGDSHVVLPECELTIAELMDGPLLPFIAAIEAGADSIMMGHLVFPAIAESQGLPASLSPFFAGELLRKRLGFEGVICTDDIEMGAIKKNFHPEDVGVMAVLAGNDMILMCHTPEFQERVIAGIRQAVLDGVIAESRIDESVSRIHRLYAKFRQYQAAARPIPRENWNEAARQYAHRTVKVSRDPQQLLPLSAERSYLLILPRQEQLTIADNSGGQTIGLAALLEARGLSVQVEYCSMKPEAAEIANLCAKAAGHTVIQGTLNAHLFQGQLELAAQLAVAGPLLNLVLRNPYDDTYLPQNAGSILLCSTSDYSLEALAELLVMGK